MRRGRVATLTVAVALAIGAAPASAEPIEVGHIPECVELVPASLAVPPGAPVTLDVLMLLDGEAALARGPEVASAISASYEPLGIPVQASFLSVTLSGTDALNLIEQSKAVLGGARPGGVDVVYTLTDKNIEALGSDAVAGLADCIGGVAFPARAFAVGEVLDPDDSSIGDVVVAGSLTAKVAAHEIGHLMGGHHHYANCAEGLSSEAGAELSPCSLMFNDVGLSSFNFSALNSLVVRGHAESYVG